jgi:hypothetical protein
MPLSLVAQLTNKLSFVQENLVEENVDYLDMKAVEDKINDLYDEMQVAIAAREEDEADEESDDEDDEEEE